jgi:hypothetical protein
MRWQGSDLWPQLEQLPDIVPVRDENNINDMEVNLA